MATYTPNYQLYQWIPEDKFLRTDFNEDFSKINTALKAAEGAAEAGDQKVLGQAQAWASAAQSAASTAQITADRALADLEPVSYNVYNLMLQNYYDGKVTGWKKALFFDGFRDQSGIASLNSMNWDGPNRSLLLDAVGQQQSSVAFGCDYTFMLSTNNKIGLDWTASGNGTLTKVETYIQGSGTLVISKGGQELVRTPIAQSQLKGIASVTVNMPIEVGVTYRFEVHSGSSTITVSVAHSSYNMGVRLSFTPKVGTAGSMVSVAVSPGVTAQRAVAWVRHLNGTASLSLQIGGSWISMTRTATRTTVNSDGTSCTESAFTLERGLSGSLTTRLSFSTSAGKSVRVYDYGVILM